MPGILTGAGGDLGGRGKPGTSGWEALLLQKLLNQKGVELGRGGGGKKEGILCSGAQTFTSFMVGQVGTSRRKQQPTQLVRDTASLHSPKQSTPNDSLGDESHFNPLNHFPEFGDHW